MNREFKFLLDPLFIFALALYTTNRYLFGAAEVWDCQLCRSYLGDLLLVPVLIPLILALSKLLKLRTGSSPPSLLEIGLPLAIWSVSFEIIGPLYFGRGTADRWDVLAYALGGLISWLIWSYRGRQLSDKR